MILKATLQYINGDWYAYHYDKQAETGTLYPISLKDIEYLDAADLDEYSNIHIIVDNDITKIQFNLPSAKEEKIQSILIKNKQRHDRKQ